MTAPTQAQIEAAKVLHQLKWLYSADGDERDPKALEIISTALTAAAKAGETARQFEIRRSQERNTAYEADIKLLEEQLAATIERCAQVAEDILGPEPMPNGFDVPAAIRAMKD